VIQWLLPLLLLGGQSTFSPEDLAAFEQRRKWLAARGVLTETAEGADRPAHLNALIHADSPYLLSHSLQPVDWREWRDEYAEGAGDDSRLIFVSIGYDTCHWCHVMAEETFSSEEVAAILNPSYFSIKVDREQWPIVDQRFRRALEQIKGEAGWPINAVLTPQGKLLWIDSYLPKAEFIRVFTTLASRWKRQPEALMAMSETLASQLKWTSRPVVREAVDWPVVLEEQQAKVGSLLREEQTLEAGPRFLREYWLLGLADEHLRSSTQSLAVVEKQVDSILQSPVYDAVEGGFHRYSVDGAWQRPHFEKMLYTQAFMVRVLARLYVVTGKRAYLRAMDQTIQWTESRLRVGPGYGSAVSAVSAGGEGSYYRFGSEAVGAIRKAGLQVTSGEGEDVLVSIGSLDGDWRVSVEERGLRAFRSRRDPPPLDEKVILSWNAMMILGLLDAYDATSKEEYLHMAQRVSNDLWRAARVDGRLHRIVFQGRASIDASLEDVAWYALSQLRLSEHEGADDAKGRAEWLLQELSERYRFSDVQQSAEDNEIPSLYSVVLQAMAAGYRQTGQSRFREAQSELVAGHELTASALAADYSYVAAVADARNHVSLGCQAFADGHGRLAVVRSPSGIRVSVRLDPGWHVNANPASNGLIPIEVVKPSVEDGAAAVYPSGEKRQLEFSSGAPLGLYEGMVVIPVSIPSLDDPRVRVRLQACTDTLCLLPEVVTVIVPGDGDRNAN